MYVCEFVCTCVYIIFASLSHLLINPHFNLLIYLVISLLNRPPIRLTAFFHYPVLFPSFFSQSARSFKGCVSLYGIEQNTSRKLRRGFIYKI